MRFSFVSVTILLAGAVSADWTREVDGGDQSHLLVKRLETCRGSSCATCFGAGSIVCEGNSCFNPTAGEQCCKGGKYCIGKDASCCSAGPGITGGVLGGAAGVTSTRAASVTSVRAPTATNLALPSGSTWSCKTFDSDEECCQRGGSNSHWCSGSGSRIHCYRPERGDICCSNGKSCLGDGCCAQLGASSISPVPTTAKTTSTTRRLTATDDDDTRTGTSTTSRFSLNVASAGGTGATSTATGSSFSGGNGPLSASDASETLVKGFAVAIVGVVGLIAML